MVYADAFFEEESSLTNWLYIFASIGVILIGVGILLFFGKVKLEYAVFFGMVLLAFWFGFTVTIYTGLYDKKKLNQLNKNGLTARIKIEEIELVAVV
jgi:hypothetical protein